MLLNVICKHFISFVYINITKSHLIKLRLVLAVLLFISKLGYRQVNTKSTHDKYFKIEKGSLASKCLPD
ncbi:MAG: hypothetical protein ACI9QN_000325 [Arcticibacterium sp.]|jgi:hypothetical protein